jgi:hypothetical protein
MIKYNSLCLIHDIDKQSLNKKHMALQPGVGQSLLLFWDFIPKVFLVGN